MQTNAQYLIKDLEKTRKNIITINKGFRDACDQNFYNLASAYKEALDEKNLKVETIKQTKIETSLKEIKQQLASEWNTTEDNLFVSYTTSLDFVTFSDDYATIKADNFNATKEHSLSDIDIQFTISTMPNDIKDLQSVNFSTKLNFQGLQMDEQPLYEHLEAKPLLNTKTGTLPRVKLNIDDIDQIVVVKRLNELIYENIYNGKSQPRDFISEVIINTPSLPFKETTIIEDITSGSQEEMLQ